MAMETFDPAHVQTRREALFFSSVETVLSVLIADCFLSAPLSPEDVEMLHSLSFYDGQLFVPLAYV